MNRKNTSIYTAGLLQGTALVAFPASSTILTNPSLYGFTSTQYGSLFIPQSILSILAALASPLFCKYMGSQRTLAAGLIANILSMALLAFSAVTIENRAATYGMLMIATGCLGAGFGMVVPTINRMAENLYPLKSDAAVLILNALLGIGTTLAPLILAFFSAIGYWSGLPLSLTLALIALLIYSLGTCLPEEKIVPEQTGEVKDLPLVSVFAAFAFLYGIIETLNGNWLSIYMKNHLDASINIQSFVLTAFWGMVTFGRLFFAAISKFLSEQTAFQIAPFISAIAFLIISSLISGQVYWALTAFGLAGFGCSVLLPLLISFGGKKLKSYASAIPGMIISSYLLGYGVAAFGVGPLEEFSQIDLRMIYIIGAVISFVLGVLSFYIVRAKKSCY